MIYPDNKIKITPAKENDHNAGNCEMTVPEGSPHILIVDDDEGISVTLSDILEINGYSVTIAMDASEALGKVEKGVFDLVLIDMKLPDMGGISLMKKIKGIDPDICCIMITGYESSQAETEAFQAGAYSYLTKPFEMDSLLSTLKQAIALQRPHTDLD